MKFVISRTQREAVLEQLQSRLRPDENAGADAWYPIVSLYYDNAARDCYWERTMGVANRRKLRVRLYGSRDGVLPPTCFLEIKQKCEGRGVKRRARLPLSMALEIASGRPAEATLPRQESRLVEEVHDLVHRRNFRPVCVMRYDRQAFAGQGADADLRVTFDSGVACRLDRLDPEPDDRRFTRYLLPEGSSVMEIKVTESVPYWVSRLVADAGCVLQSHSKYCHALETLEPVLQNRGRAAEIPAERLAPDLAAIARGDLLAAPLAQAS